MLQMLILVAALAKVRAESCAEHGGGHTMCNPRSPSLIQSFGRNMNPGTRAQILNDHNNYRSNVQPTAANMVQMIWDDNLADVAEKHAATCIFGHDSGHQRTIKSLDDVIIGQNVGTSSTDEWPVIVKMWYDEVKDFNYNGGAMGMVGHFTQMMLWRASRIGCGHAKCQGSNYYYVCNYAAGIGPDDQMAPWEAGPPCSKCPGSCQNNLCAGACAGKVCSGYSDINVATCSC